MASSCPAPPSRPGFSRFAPGAANDCGLGAGQPLTATRRTRRRWRPGLHSEFSSSSESFEDLHPAGADGSREVPDASGRVVGSGTSRPPLAENDSERTSPDGRPVPAIPCPSAGPRDAPCRRCGPRRVPRHRATRHGGTPAGCPPTSRRCLPLDTSHRRIIRSAPPESCLPTRRRKGDRTIRPGGPAKCANLRPRSPAPPRRSGNPPGRGRQYARVGDTTPATRSCCSPSRRVCHFPPSLGPQPQHSGGAAGDQRLAIRVGEGETADRCPRWPQESPQLCRSPDRAAGPLRCFPPWPPVCRPARRRLHQGSLALDPLDLLAGVPPPTATARHLPPWQSPCHRATTLQRLSRGVGHRDPLLAGGPSHSQIVVVLARRANTLAVRRERDRLTSQRDHEASERVLPIAGVPQLTPSTRDAPATSRHRATTQDFATRRTSLSSPGSAAFADLLAGAQIMGGEKGFWYIRDGDKTVVGSRSEALREGFNWRNFHPSLSQSHNVSSS